MKLRVEMCEPKSIPLCGRMCLPIRGRIAFIEDLASEKDVGNTFDDKPQVKSFKKNDIWCKNSFPTEARAKSKCA